MLPPMAVDRIRRHVADGTTVLHMYTSKLRPLPETGQTEMTKSFSSRG
jgi:hypothetical protein